MSDITLYGDNKGSLQAPVFSEDLFLSFKEYVNRKDTTMKGYMGCLRQFAKWMQDNGIKQPNRKDILAYKEHLCNSGYTAGTQRQYLRAVKQFFNWTSFAGLYPNVAENIHGAVVRTDIHKKDALSKEDVMRIADTIDVSDEQGKRLYTIFLLCLTCGLRTIEIHRANVGDIKEAGDITYLYIQGKGHDEKDQPVELIPEVLDALRDYLKVRETPVILKSPLFTSTSNRSKGGRIATTTISTMIKKMLVSAGYDNDRITAHSLRHTSGTAAYKATGNIYVAQKHQRHSDPKTTEIYIHAEERRERHTEQQVYDYLFTEEGNRDEYAEIIGLIKNLPKEKINLVTSFVKALK